DRAREAGSGFAVGLDAASTQVRVPKPEPCLEALGPAYEVLQIQLGGMLVATDVGHEYIARRLQHRPAVHEALDRAIVEIRLEPVAHLAVEHAGGQRVAHRAA